METEPANITHIIPLAAVYFNVTNQIALLKERLIALVAFERLQILMAPVQMRQVIRFLLEDNVAILALPRPRRLVRVHVFIQRARVRPALVANRALVQRFPISRVRIEALPNLELLPVRQVRRRMLEILIDRVVLRVALDALVPQVLEYRFGLDVVRDQVIFDVRQGLELVVAQFAFVRHFVLYRVLEDLNGFVRGHNVLR